MPATNATHEFSLLFFIFLIFSNVISTSRAELAFNACHTDPVRTAELIHQTNVMFDHAFDSYLTHAFPHDELRSLSCKGADTFGGLTLTLIDSLDSLVLFRRWPRFVWAAKYLRNHLTFDVNDTVSVFETTIRAVGGLVSAHAILVGELPQTGFDPQFWYPHYDDALLRLAIDIADRLLPAFRTATGIPFGAIHLQRGVHRGESRVASTAGAGSLLLEFGTLSRLTNDPRYYRVAFKAMHALHVRAAWTGLVGNHINIDDGTWVATDSGVGGLVDSFYEYMAKGYIAFGDPRLLRMFRVSSSAVQSFVRRAPWFLDADMWSGHTSNVFQSSLSAFYPGLETLMGRIGPATETTRAHFSVWRKYGCLPEGYNVVSSVPMSSQVNYPLRPELVESIFYLHWATNDPMWIGAAATMLHSLEALARTPCGYAEISDVRVHERGDIMPSFLLSETLKYLLLTFDAHDSDGRPHWMRRGGVVLTTEAHPIRITRREEMEAIFGPNVLDERIFDAANNHRNDFQHRVDTTATATTTTTNDSGTGSKTNKSSSGDRKASTSRSKSGSRSQRLRQPAHRLKCKLPAQTAAIPCGYSMEGSDFPPVVEVESLPAGDLSAALMARVERLMRDNGVHSLQVGGPGVGRREFRLVEIGAAAVASGQCERRRVGRLVARSRCPRVSRVVLTSASA